MRKYYSEIELRSILIFLIINPAILAYHLITQVCLISYGVYSHAQVLAAQREKGR